MNLSEIHRRPTAATAEKEKRQFKLKRSCWTPKIVLAGSKLRKLLSCWHVLLFLKKEGWFKGKSHREFLPQPWDLIKELPTFICPVRFQNHCGPVTPLCVPCPPNPPLEKLTPFGDYKRFQSNRNQKRAGEKGALILCHFRPVSAECISIAKSSLLWLLSANLLVTRVSVRKLKQSGGNFPPPHFTHLVPSVSVNFPSLPLLYTKQLPSF